MTDKSVSAWLEEEISDGQRCIKEKKIQIEEDPSHYTRATMYGQLAYEEGWIDGLKVALSYMDDFGV